MIPSTFPNYFRRKRVLVTGHTGFVGSWLTLALVELGAEVTGYALDPPTQPSLFDILGLRHKIRDARGDIRDKSHLHRTIRAGKPEVAFHLAAQPLVSTGYREPVLTFETNVMGTANLLEECRRSSDLESVVVVTSDKCYATEPSGRPHAEGSPLGGDEPYASSKACVELLTRAFRESYFADRPPAVATARAGNVLGGGDWSAMRIVPDCIRALSESRPIRLRCPDAVRPWQHVLDVVHGYLLLAQSLGTGKPDHADAWNFGPMPGAALTVEDLVRRVIGEWGGGAYSVERVQDLRETRILTLDSTKARRELNWRPLLNAEQTIRNTVTWYKRYLHGDQMGIVTSTDFLRPFLVNALEMNA